MIVMSCRTVFTTQRDTLLSMASQCLMSFLNDTHYSRETHWSMASQGLLSFLNRKKKQKRLINASIIKIGLSGDLLGGFRGIATIEATETASGISMLQF